MLEEREHIVFFDDLDLVQINTVCALADFSVRFRLHTIQIKPMHT